MLSEEPTAESLLADRLARGWKPTPTSMQDGTEVLGHAACVPQDLWQKL